MSDKIYAMNKDELLAKLLEVKEMCEEGIEENAEKTYDSSYEDASKSGSRSAYGSILNFINDYE